MPDHSPPARLPEQPTDVDDLRSLIDYRLGPTRWHLITQGEVDTFADLTGDHNWMHVDPGRAGRSSLGTTISHGLLTLARGPGLMAELLDFSAFPRGFHYGYERVRFPSTAPVGGRIRLAATPSAVAVKDGAVRLSVRQTFECERGIKPVCVATAIVYLQPQA